ncbi:MAG: Minf_1886 family protein [Planctomycetota bacterium]|nr:hypothetical protein [Planctomycetota bacterium]
MSSEKTESILRICGRDGRYAPQAYYFVFDALDYTIQRMNKMRHVTGRELLEGVRLYATENFGFLARSVLEEWGVRCTEDLGNIVFNLVEGELLSRTETDRREDFVDVFDFDDAFDQSFRKSLQDVRLTS